MTLSRDELNVILNSWPANTVGHAREQIVIAQLDAMGQQIGYGALSQLAKHLYEIQCHGAPENAIALKRSHFASLGWQLPDGFPKE